MYVTCLESDAYGIDHYNVIVQSLMWMVRRLMSLYTTPLLEIENYINCFYKVCIILRHVVVYLLQIQILSGGNEANIPH